MNRRSALLVGAGGAVGATVRWAIATVIDAEPFPWPTLVVNLVGCLVLGLVAFRDDASSRRHDLRHLVGVGFCGGLTTFSTLSVELAALLRSDDTTTAFVYLATSLVGGALAVMAGLRLGPGRQ